MELCAFQSTEKIFSPYICEPPYYCDICFKMTDCIHKDVFYLQVSH